jgi:DNA replication protein DnaC
LESSKRGQPINTKICEKHNIELKEKGEGNFKYIEQCPQCWRETEDKRLKEYEDSKNNFKNKLLEKIIKGEMRWIPERFKNSSLNDFQGFGEYSEKESIIILGPCGTGKTHLSIAIAKNILIKRVEKFINDENMNWYLKKLESGNANEGSPYGYKQLNLFCNFQELSIQIKSSFRKESSSMDQIIESWLKDFAIFDDIGMAKPTETAIEALYMIVNRRYEEMIPTVYTTNYSLSEISSIYGDRIASRLSDCRQIKLEGKDRRILK